MVSATNATTRATTNVSIKLLKGKNSVWAAEEKETEKGKLFVENAFEFVIGRSKSIIALIGKKFSKESRLKTSDCERKLLLITVVGVFAAANDSSITSQSTILEAEAWALLTVDRSGGVV